MLEYITARLKIPVIFPHSPEKSKNRPAVQDRSAHLYAAAEGGSRLLQRLQRGLGRRLQIRLGFRRSLLFLRRSLLGCFCFLLLFRLCRLG